MKPIFRRICDRAYTSAGLYRLAEGFGSFMLVHMGFLLFTNLQSVFINTLFIRLTGNSDSVMLYNVITNCFGGPMMLVSAFVSRRSSPTNSMKIGILFHIAMYLLFFLSMDNLATVMPLIAALAGIGNGFYWFSYSYIINVYSTDESRDLAISLVGVLGGAVALAMPTISGLVISRFSGITGYAVMFTFSLCMAILTIFLSRRMRTIPSDDRHSHLLPLLRMLVKDKRLLLCLSGEYCKCLREGICGFLFSILLFEAVRSEAIVGVNALLTGVISILGAWGYGRLVRGKNRIQSVVISTSLLLLLALVLFVNLSPVMIILYSVCNALLGTFLMNPTFSITYGLVLQSPKTRPAMPEFIGVRECVVGLGRISGILFTLLLPRTTMGSVTAICVLTALQYITALIFHIAQRPEAVPPQTPT